MKKTVVLAGIVILFSFIYCKEQKKETKGTNETPKVEVLSDGAYNVKADQVIKWEGYKPAGKHDGTIAIKEGKISVKDGKVESGNFVFDMATITVLDIPADDEYNEKLRSHLMNDHFFDVEKNPTASFAISKVEGSNVTGDLTIKGITKPVTFVMEVAKAGENVKITAPDIQIDRTDFDIKYKSKKFFENLKDKFIDDNFKISFEVEAAK